MIRELAAGATHLGFEAMRELRTELPSVDEFVRVVDEVQRPEGYRLVGSFEADVDHAVAVAGFRTGRSLSWGHFVYVDDLVTMAAHRGGGHASTLFDWLMSETGRLGCDQLHLDSGTHRHDAHRFYLTHRMRIPGFHFVREV